MTKAEILERVRVIVIEHLDVAPEKVTAASDFIGELGADSLDYVELTMAFEEAFDIEIADDAAEDIKTVGQAADYIAGKLSVDGVSEDWDDIFGGRGAPLNAYSRGQEDWPAVWRLPDDMFDQDGADLFEKMATLTDDVVLRTAVNCWDNCIRAPGAFEGVAGGLLSAHARLVVGLLGAGELEDVEQVADTMREAWLGMAKQALAINKGGWDSARLNDNED